MNPMMLFNMLMSRIGTNNPVLQLFNAARTSNNPMLALQQASQNNPQLREVMQMVNGQTPQQMQQTFMNMAQQSGLNLPL